MRSLAACLVGVAVGVGAGYTIWGTGERGALRLEKLEAEPCRVATVVDGDTIVLENGLHVRYIGADSPEIFRFRKDPQPFAPAASKMNLELVGGRMIRLEFEKEKIDKHGRLLAHAYVEDESGEEVSVEERLIAAGLATATHIKPNVELYRRFKAIEDEAKAKEVGLWSQRPGSHGSVDDPGAPFVASSRSTVYHKAGCPAGAKINPGNRLYYTTRAAAELSGRKPCSVCMPGEARGPAPGDAREE
jgi:micrococcal nuclease